MVHDRGDIFAKIAVRHDYSGEYVVFRDQDVTAFLDIKDPQHPRYKPDHDEDGPVDSSKPRAQSSWFRIAARNDRQDGV